MKKVLFGLVIFVVGLTMVSVAEAQTAPTGAIGFAGIRYDDGVVASYGVGTHLAGNLGLFSYLDYGKYGAINTELSYMFETPVSGLYLGLIAGPNVSWTDPTGDPVTYLVGASGFVAAYDLTTKIGAWSYGKYKFAFDNNVAFQNGSNFGAGLFYRF